MARGPRLPQFKFNNLFNERFPMLIFSQKYFFDSGYFASRGKIAPCYFGIWRQNSPKCYLAYSAKIALAHTLTFTLILAITLTLILALTLPLRLTPTLT